MDKLSKEIRIFFSVSDDNDIRSIQFLFQFENATCVHITPANIIFCSTKTPQIKHSLIDMNIQGSPW